MRPAQAGEEHTLGRLHRTSAEAGRSFAHERRHSRAGLLLKRPSREFDGGQLLDAHEPDAAVEVEAVLGGAVGHDGDADVAGNHGELADDGVGGVGDYW